VLVVEGIGLVVVELDKVCVVVGGLEVVVVLEVVALTVVVVVVGGFA
jgi:hypothetical protein